MDLVLRGASVTAAEALRIGLVTAVLPDRELLAGAIALAQELAQLPPLQVKLTRRMFAQNAAAVDAEQVMRNENDAFIELLRTLKRDKPL